MREALLAAAAVTLWAAPAAAGLYPHVVTGNAAITVKTDDDVLVALPSNPSTGYTWSAALSDRTVIAADGAAYKAPAKAMPGAGGEQVLAFEALKPGTATITLSYARPFEKNAKAAQTVVVTVTVKK